MESDNWAAQTRMKAVEFRAYWTETVYRQNLMDSFGVSIAQSSADLQRYLRHNPDSIRYDPRARRYFAKEDMTCVLQTPVIEEAMTVFLSPDQSSRLNYLGFRPAEKPENGPTEDSRVAFLELPERKAKAAVERKVFLAVYHRRRLRMRYFSAKSGDLRWRLVVPTSFAHDGYRWHVRAWCEENESYRDFVLGRIVDADYPKESRELKEADKDWNSLVTLKVKINPKLPEGTRRAYEQDYGIRSNGTLTVKVRKAMEIYIRRAFGLPVENSEIPRFVE